MSDLTQLLELAHKGDRQAAAELLPLVYEELRKLAAAKMASEKPGQTLEATALVHEAYLRLVGNQNFEGRIHFFAAAAEAMRRILVDRARRRESEKRGGQLRRVPLELANSTLSPKDNELLSIHEEIDRLATVDPVSADLVKLRYFIGLSMEESASSLGISLRKAERLWTFGRAWLKDAIQNSQKK